VAGSVSQRGTEQKRPEDNQKKQQEAYTAKVEALKKKYMA